MTDSLSRQFARWTANLRYDDLPLAVVDKVKALLLHGLMGAALGAPTEHAREAIQLTKAEEGKPDGATILTDGGRATRVGAAFAASEVIHASGLFDSYRMLTHPGPILIPAALVNAELAGRDGRELITALAAGYELVCRLCDDVIPSTAARGFRPSPLFGTLGAALASGKLLGLDEDGLVNTIALAATFASGLNEGPRVGSGEMNIHEPQAARNGVFAAIIGREGRIKGAETAIEGRAGFYNAFMGSSDGTLSHAFQGPLHFDPAGVAAGLGEQYKLLTVMFRMYPVAGYNQPVIDLMAELKQQHNLNHADIAQVAVAMNPIETLYPSPDFPRLPDWNTPRISTTHYFAAHAAVRGGFPVVGQQLYSNDDDGPTATDVIDFMRERVTLVQEPGRAMFSPAITVTMRDGTVHQGDYPYARMEWTFSQLVERLRDCLPGFPLGEQGFDRLHTNVLGADLLPNITPLLEVVQVP